MSEENLLRVRLNCCRLCLAPETECISIFNSYAADKEPLSTKIYNCVGIKITADDRLSLRICHSCISYLNSWQSFKNRCQASQNKQRLWLENDKRADNTITFSSSLTSHQHAESQQQHQKQIQHQQQKQSLEGQESGQSHIATSILDGITTLKKRKSLTVYPLPGLEIKTEPVDVDEEEGLKQQDESDEMVDPTMFLERTEEEGDEPIMSTNRFEYDSEQQQQQQQQQQIAASVPAVQNTLDLTSLADTKEAACRACNLKFSTRANARRHERNLHPNLFELSSSPNNVPITKPTAALAAALEMQRAAVAAATAAEAAKGSPISTQKYRQEIVNAFNKCEAGGFDYANPEKYQQLLTDEKIVFLQQNDEFLQQYQSMTCRCCNRFYSTYKNFMAHMRKKYAALPRNLCFNCLKLNDSKALFISHLKRRNCINLYKVMHALMTKNPSFAAAVAATTAATTDRLRARELLVNKMYECKLCPKRYRLRLEFRSHMYEEHGDMQRKDLSPTSTQCSFCGLDIDDEAERKRHYNNMECMVALRCVTCNSVYDKHQAFMDHVHEQHLAGFGEQMTLENNGQKNISPGKKSIGGASSNDESRSQLAVTTTSGTQQVPQKSQYFSRMPQACPICGQQYNNYNNVLRHMESKHPDQLPQTYKCVRCGVGYPRLSNLREHMVTQHAADKARHTGFEYIVNADAVKLTDTNAQNAYSGRYDYVMKDLMSITNGGAMDEEEEQQEPTEQQKRKKPRLDLNNSNSSHGNNGINNNNNNHYSSLKECPICAAVFSNNIGLSNHMRSHTAAAQSAAAAALAAARNSTPSSLTITASPSGTSNSKAAQQQLMFKRNLEQAADRRFRRMRCRICQRRFSSKKSYRFHMLNDHQIKNVQFIKCKLCDAEFAYEKGLKVHMFKIHNTLLKDEMIIKQYECDICSIVYRTEVEMLQHKRNVHGDEEAHAQQNRGVADETLGLETSSGDVSGISTPIGGLNNSNLDSSTAGQLLWYQCKYCPSNFNTNKKLAIHINSHDEFDSNDYSCKDCGNVYSGRKSLWVHRYKKHPQVSNPSECTLCKKVFFDSQMLENHTPTCNRKPITATGALATGAADSSVYYKHKTGDDDDDGSRDVGEEGGASGSGHLNMMNIKMPEVACTMCGARFTDQELFTKHIEMHEMELYTDNPLAAMFDTGPADPNQFYLDRVNENGEYACDLCSKAFTQMTALKVHRKWHFRGDSKQNATEADANSREVLMNSSSSHRHSYHHSHKQQQQLHSMSSHPHLQGLQAVGLMPNPRPHSKSQKRKLELKCEYCPSTFISNNNLRRHIYELHKDVIRNMPAPPEIELDEALQCRRCEMKFEVKQDWIEHKISDARVMKPYGPFQWGCDLCGAYVSRKEKLINHIHNHMKESVIIPAKQLEEQQQQEQKQQQHEQQQQQNQNFENALSTIATTLYPAKTMTTSKIKDEKKTVKALEREMEKNVEVKQEILEVGEEEGEEFVDEPDDELDNAASVDSGRGAYGEDMQDDEDNESAEVDEEVDYEGVDNNNDDDDDDDDEDDDAEVDSSADDDVLNVHENANEEGLEHKNENVNETNDEAEDDDDDDDDDDDEDEEEGEGIEDNDDEHDNESESDTTNQSSVKLGKHNININQHKLVAYHPDSDDEDIEDEEAEDNDNSNRGISNNDRNNVVEDDEDQDMEDDTVSSVYEVQKENVSDSAAKSHFSCDLCQVYFNSQSELQQHVKMHFLNGPGSVTLTKHNPAKRNIDSMTMSSS